MKELMSQKNISNIRKCLWKKHVFSFNAASTLRYLNTRSSRTEVFRKKLL